MLVSSYEAARSRVLECKDPECHGAQQPGSGCLFFTTEGSCETGLVRCSPRMGDRACSAPLKAKPVLERRLLAPKLLCERQADRPVAPLRKRP